MLILADENIPYVRDAFGPLGEVRTMPGRAMTPEAVRDAELLLVRSITKVDRTLLDGSAVRFVATATIGEDHIDKAYLEERGIAFSSAPGSNADSVRQYVTAALLVLAERFDLDLASMSLGIVGVGNVGSRVQRNAEALGLTCVLNDPPLARATGYPKYRPLDEALSCDIVTFHVPLTKSGEDATYHLVNDDTLGRMRDGAFLLNTSRGAVVETAALKRALASGRIAGCVLDVWEGEPDIDVELLQQVVLGSPHIAGYSFDGKVNGTRMIYEAACRFLREEPAWDSSPLLPAPECPRVSVDSTQPDALPTAVRQVYDITSDDAAMRGLCDVAPEERPKHFDRLRKEYPRRREFFNTTAVVSPPNVGLQRMLAGLGFVVEVQPSS